MPSDVYARLDGPDGTLVLELGDGVPRVAHWGARPPPGADLKALVRARRPSLAQSGLDAHVPLTLLPETALGWTGHPGLLGSRADGTGWAPLLRTVEVAVGTHAVVWRGADPRAGVSVALRVDLDDASGVLSLGCELTNAGPDRYLLARLSPTLPLPTPVGEVMTLPGRWAKELQPQRQPLRIGALVTENTTGRTSHESSPTVFAGEAGFSEQRGEVYAAHLAWSGNHALRVEACADGRAYLQAAELLLPGEVALAPGERYPAPTVHAAYSPCGLTALSGAFHTFQRGRPGHPGAPRKVLLNTWEAVYFEHDVSRLKALADRAAEVGVERFVLDDGWFRGRHDDTTALGDWFVDEQTYPDGLGVLVDHVRGLGMEFGLWVEPEMVNPDSDLFRAHPDWVLAVAGYPPVLARHQLVLDLDRGEVFAYLLERLDALLAEHVIGYLKWDMNRSLVHAGHDGRAGGHRQTLRLYDLLDEIGRRHPGVEIESCASGGARADLGILARTQRIWTSDCNDALERQQIQRGFSYVFPPELMGAHIGPSRSHTTGRVHSLAFRAATALFGHLGIEWDLSAASTEDRAAVAEVVALHKRLRPLLHSGTVVRVDHPDPAVLVHGVVARDRGEAVFAHVQLVASATTLPLTVRLPGLDTDRPYRVERLRLPGEEPPPGKSAPPWWDDGLVVDGGTLAASGLAMALHHPETATLLHLTSA